MTRLVGRIFCPAFTTCRFKQTHINFPESPFWSGWFICGIPKYLQGHKFWLWDKYQRKRPVLYDGEAVEMVGDGGVLSMRGVLEKMEGVCWCLNGRRRPEGVLLLLSHPSHLPHTARRRSRKGVTPPHQASQQTQPSVKSLCDSCCMFSSRC